MENTTLQLATWNVNSLKVRLPQVLDWLDTHKVDVLCLQELKLTDDKVPVDALREAGYHTLAAGQPTYNGVAILSRHEVREPLRNIPGLDDPQQRLISATIDSPIGEIRVISAYCPNGQSLDSDKYPYKLAWYAALHQHLQNELQRYPRLALLGDFNVAPEDRDVHDPAKWEGDVLVSEPERAALRALFDLGLHDAFRLFEQPEKIFSWWDYRRLGFQRNAGLRIDHVLLSDALKPYCVACHVDKEPRRLPQPSDHAPVVAQLQFKS